MASRGDRTAIGSRMADRSVRRPLSTRLAAIGRFEARALGIAALAVALLFAASPLTVTPTRAAEPRVAIIVGPAGAATDSYRSDGLAAAAEAAKYTSDVVTVISPDATWPAARAAMQGASIVVYLGHGNGFPSPYGSTAKPATQNGLGLNPVAGGDDSAHQYFGEAYLAREVQLAPHAVVLLHHLCYASGNGEPGMADPDLDTAEQRVDNYAAGWLAAGAEAVVADSSTSAGPAWYVRAILSGRGSIEGIWRAAPSFHDHVIAFASTRAPGMTGLLDPTRPDTRFYRSLVARAALRADEVARGAALVDRAPATAPTAPAGPVVTGLRLGGSPVVGASLPLTVESAAAPPKGAGLGVRWDRLTIADPQADWSPDRSTPGADATTAAPDGGPSSATPDAGEASPGDSAASVPTAPSASAAPSAAAAPAASTVPEPSAAAAAGAPAAETAPEAAASIPASPPPSAASSPAPEAAAAVLVTPEVAGDLVRVERTRRGDRSLVASVSAPDEPGIYRLVVTIHDDRGVAYDAGTQARIPAMLVRVSGSASAAIGAPGSVVVLAGESFRLPLAVTNTGDLAWIAPEIPDARIAEPATPRGALLVGHWVDLAPADRSVPPEDALASVLAEPGATAQATLALVAPAAPGDYLLVLDVVSPVLGSLTARGMPPVAIPVRVEAPPPAPGTPSR